MTSDVIVDQWQNGRLLTWDFDDRAARSKQIPPPFLLLLLLLLPSFIHSFFPLIFFRLITLRWLLLTRGPANSSLKEADCSLPATAAAAEAEAAAAATAAATAAAAVAAAAAAAPTRCPT